MVSIIPPPLFFSLFQDDLLVQLASPKMFEPVLSVDCTEWYLWYIQCQHFWICLISAFITDVIITSVISPEPCREELQSPFTTWSLSTGWKDLVHGFICLTSSGYSSGSHRYHPFPDMCTCLSRLHFRFFEDWIFYLDFTCIPIVYQDSNYPITSVRYIAAYVVSAKIQLFM